MATDEKVKIKQTFESAMKRLEEIVRTLESGQASLDETIKLYSEGIKLAAFCREKLDKAENTVKIYRAVPNDENAEAPDGDGADNNDKSTNDGSGKGNGKRNV